LAGLAAFLLVWQAAISATRPAPVRPVTLAFSALRDGEACVVALGARGDVLLRERLALAAAGLPEAGGRPGPAAAPAGASERLRTWLGAVQPTLVAIPPAAPSSASPVGTMTWSRS